MKKSILFTLLTGLSLIACNRSSAQIPEWLWATSAGGTNEDHGNAVATDALGNLYMTGYFLSPAITFGSYTLTNSGGNDMYLVKYDAGGNVLWAKNAGGTGNDEGRSVAVDVSGNAYVTGYFSGPTIVFGSYTLTNAGYEDIFLVKYDPGGTVLWAKSAGGTFHDIGTSVVLDGSGNVYVAGYFESYTINFGPVALMNAGGNDIFLAKYDDTGNILWATNPYGPSQDLGYSVAVDNSGNAYVTGYFSTYTYLIFGKDTLVSAGANDLFLAKYDAGGNSLWAKRFGGTGNDIGNSVAVDLSGNVFMTGYFSSARIIFGSDTLVNAGGNNLFLAKFDSGGNALWAKSAGGAKFDYGCSVVADASGNAFITGAFSSLTISFGPYILTNAGSTNYTEDLLLAKYDAGGNALWAKSAGGSNNESGNSVAVDVPGNAFVTGYYSSPAIIFGPDTLTNAGSTDVFLVKAEGSPTGIDGIKGLSAIRVYPNPAGGRIRITLPAGETGSVVRIVTMEGKELLQGEVNQANPFLDVSKLPGGIYLVKAVGEKGVQVGKFVKQQEIQ